MWIKEGINPTSTTRSSTGTNVTFDSTQILRGDDWFCSMHARDKATGKRKIPDDKPKTKAAAGKYLKYREKEVEGELVLVGNHDALYFSLGEKEDHPGRARRFGGVDVGVRKVFGPLPKGKRTKTSAASSSDDLESIKSSLRLEIMQEMREEIRGEVREEMKREIKEEIKGEMKKDMLTMLQELGFNLKLPESTPFVPKEMTPCHLCLRNASTSKLFEVGHGTPFPPGENVTCHHTPITSGNLKVSVIGILDEFRSAPLPAPVVEYNLMTLQDVIGSFVEWPADQLMFSDKKQKLPPSKGRVMSQMGSKEPNSKGSDTKKIQGLVANEVYANLSAKCIWLHDLAIGMTDGDAIAIPFSRQSFFLDEDPTPYVGKVQSQNFYVQLG